MNQQFFPPQSSQFPSSQGRVDLPILYYDTTAAYAFFDAATDACRTILTGTGLKPLELPGGRSLVGIAVYEYRATTVGVYNEVGLALVCLPESQRMPLLSLVDLFLPGRMRKLGFYVADLPVTTAAANAAGREIWGYPKFVTQIPIAFEDDSMKMQVKNPDFPQDNIVTLEGSFSETVSLPNFDLVTWSNLKSDLIRTHVTVRGSAYYSLRPGMKLTVGEKEHHMQRNLKLLGLDGRQPLAMAISRNFQSILPQGEIFSKSSA